MIYLKRDYEILAVYFKNPAIYIAIYKVVLNNVKGKSIEQRPKAANETKEYGYWEMTV